MSSPERTIAGVDEAGRGPLVGSVVAAAVVLPDASVIDGLADSKRLSARKRAELAEHIKSLAPGWAIGEATADEIDRINILQATMLAMRRAVNDLPAMPYLVLVDGNRCPADLPCACEAVIKGDATIPVISAASILAKVHRDAQMDCLHQQYPDYGFDRHRGYPTAAHLQAIKKFGVLPLHRRSYRPVREALEQAETCCSDQTFGSA